MSDESGEDRAEAPGRGRPGPQARTARWRRNPDAAAVLAILVPGAGHLYLGRLRAAGVWLVAILVGYWAIFFPGLLLHAISIRSAYRSAQTPPVEVDPSGPRGA